MGFRSGVVAAALVGVVSVGGAWGQVGGVGKPGWEGAAGPGVTIVPTGFVALGKWTADLKLGEMEASADGRDAAVVCQKGADFVVWRKGRIGKAYPGGIAALTYSPNGMRLAYSGKRADGKCMVVVDEKEYGPYAGINGQGLRWSPDSQRLGFSVMENDDGLAAVVIDGKMSKQKFPMIWGPMFSPDSKHCMWNVDQPGTGLIVDDEPVVGMFHGSDLPYWSPDSKHTAMPGLVDEKTWALMVDRKVEEGRYTDAPEIHWSADGTRVAVVGQFKGAWHVTVDGKAMGEAMANYMPESLEFINGGKSVRWMGSMKKGMQTVIVDGKGVRDFENTSEFIFGLTGKISPDGEHFAFVQPTGAMKPKTHLTKDKQLVVDDVEIAGNLVVDHDVWGEVSPNIWDLTFSADSKHAGAFFYTGQFRYAMVDKVRGANYAGLFGVLQFSPDSKHYAYMAFKDDKKAYLIVDNCESMGFTTVKHANVAWVDATTLRCIGVDKGEVKSVTWKIALKK